MKKILVTGSVAYDILLQYDGSFKDAIAKNLDRLSVSFFSPHYARHHGGTGSNISWNLRLLGQLPMLVSTVGRDGGEYKALLDYKGVNTQYLESLNDSVTATAIIGTDSASRQIAFFHPGADAYGSWPGTKLADEREDLAYVLVGARNGALMMEAVRWCAKWKLPLLFDPGQQIIGLGKDDLLTGIKTCTGLVCNAYEWGLLSEKTGLSMTDALKHAKYVIITHGADGLTIYTRDGEEVLPACKIEKEVNPTGAGDALRAGILSGLALGWTLSQSSKLGAALASFVVEQEGTLLQDLDMDELHRRVEEAYGSSLPALP